MAFADRLKQAREAAGLTQLELAKRLNITKSSICNYENGISSPKEEIMLRLFDVLDVTPNFLFQDSFSGGDCPTSGCCNYQTIFDDSAPPTDDELKLLRKYRRLSPVHRSAIETLIDQFYPVDAGEKCDPVSRIG